jgi:hypothetical protein
LHHFNSGILAAGVVHPLAMAKFHKWYSFAVNDYFVDMSIHHFSKADEMIAGGSCSPSSKGTAEEGEFGIFRNG